MRPIGCHLSTGNGFSKAVEKAGQLGADAFQYFPKNPKSYRIKPVNARAWAKEAELARQAGVLTVGHSAYVTNLATGDPKLRETTIASIVNELEICDAYGTPYLVVHCGKHLDAGQEAGLERMVEAIDEILARFEGSTVLCLENTAGQGTEMGRTVEELLAIHERLAEPERVGFCLDTCHAFAAGLLDPDRWGAFVETVGQPAFLEKLKVVHLNDSKTPFGARRDRHELLGQGHMGPELLGRLLREPLFGHLPVLIETPVAEEDDYAGEIRLARQWAAGDAGQAEGNGSAG